MTGAVRDQRLLGLDLLVAAILALGALALYAATLLPGLGTGDTAEFQRVVPRLELAHPTGYPLYTLLGWLWTQLPLGGSPAWRLNLFSAVLAALTIGVLHLVARALGQRPLVAAAAALTFACSQTFWLQATIAEVYAPAALLQALLFLALLRWQAERWPFWVVGLILGLGLAHHRSILLMAPGAMLFLALGRRPRWREIGIAALVTLACCLLYLYVPLRAPPWRPPADVLWEYLTGSSLASNWIDLGRLAHDGLARPLDLLRTWVVPQMFAVGALLALLGMLRLLRCNRTSAALLLTGALTVFGFCCAYYVVDTPVFLIPLHLIMALLIGEGVSLLQVRQPLQLRAEQVIMLALPALLLLTNLDPVRAANTTVIERKARENLAGVPAGPALVIGSWQEGIEEMRYLQAIEGQRPDVEFAMVANQRAILDNLARGRPVYLLEPIPDLGLTQHPEGRLWRVSGQPLRVMTASPSVTWNDGLSLAGYTLTASPYRPGERVALTLAWSVEAVPGHDYWRFVHLVADDGSLWGQQDGPPSGGPTGSWASGARTIDLLGPTLDPATPPGRYHVNLGWYDPATLQRLPLTSQQGDFVTLGDIEVR